MEMEWSAAELNKPEKRKGKTEYRQDLSNKFFVFKKI